MTRYKTLAAILLCGIAVFHISAQPKYPKRALVPAATKGINGIGIRYGGYGSDLAYNPSDSTFWLLTDRGPNIDGPDSDSKIFPNPSFNPHIGVFRLYGDSLLLVKNIPLSDANGTPLNGLPLTDSDGGRAVNGERALDLDCRPLQGSIRGIDPEGLAIASDGSFWISDEYGPLLIHFAPSGRLINAFSPSDGGLPPRYARRRPNRGLEGLCINPDNGTLYGILQSPLQGSNKRVLPLFSRSADGELRDFDYPLSPEAQGVSALAVLNDSTLLVLERDGKFPSRGKGFKRIFKATIPAHAKGGTLKKELWLDILQAVPGYCHDKVEGMALIGKHMIAIANDDDFGLSSDGGRPTAKYTPAGITDRNEVIFLPLP